MARVTYALPDGGERSVDGAPGDSVMQIAVRNGVPGILAQCGGTLSCATCHVYVDPEDLGGFAEVSEFEDEMLDTTACDRADNSRLSCQLVLTELQDVRVRVAEEQT